MRKEDKEKLYKYADDYSHKVWEELMHKFNTIEGYYIGANDVSDIVLNAIIDASLDLFDDAISVKEFETDEEIETFLYKTSR